MENRVGTAIRDTLDKILLAGKAYDGQHDGPKRHYRLEERFGYVEVFWEHGEADPHRAKTSGADTRQANMRLLEKIERENRKVT